PHRHQLHPNRHRYPGLTDRVPPLPFARSHTRTHGLSPWVLLLRAPGAAVEPLWALPRDPPRAPSPGFASSSSPPSPPLRGAHDGSQTRTASGSRPHTSLIPVSSPPMKWAGEAPHICPASPPAAVSRSRDPPARPQGARPLLGATRRPPPLRIPLPLR